MKAEIVYWDSCAFLAWLQADPGQAELCAGTLERAKAGEVGIVTSTLTLTEVLWTKGGPKLPAEKAGLLRQFFRLSYVRLHNVTRGVAEGAQDVVWNHGIKPKDAIHIATALELKAPTFETFDGDLLKKSGTIGDPGLIIRKPIGPRQQGFNFGQA